MKIRTKSYITICLLLVMLTSSKVLAQGQTSWRIQEGYTIEFNGKKAKGTFQGLEGKIDFDTHRLEASYFVVSVAVSTIDTGNKTKDKHARGKKWFGAEVFPKIHFRSTLIQKTSEGYKARGELEIRDIKRVIDIPFTFDETGSQGRFEGSLTVNRKDFGIMGNMFGFMVGESFQVELSVPVQRVAGQ